LHAHPCTPETPREKGSVERAVRYLQTGIWPARSVRELGRAALESRRGLDLPSRPYRADYPRKYEHGLWLPAPRMRPEPPPVAQLIPITGPQVVPPALSDYAELCA